MAPFKLKFRMGSSRSTSQEHDPDPQVNEALLGAQQQQQGQHQHQHPHPQPLQEAVEASSSSSLDLADSSSLGQLSSERKLLLPPTSNSMRLGYLNQSRTPCINESLTDTDADTVPTTPPPSYEHVLEENTRLSQHQRQLSLDSATPNQNSRRSSANSSRHSAAQLSAALEQLAGNGGAAGIGICNDPDCRQNLNNNGATSHSNHNQNNINNNDGEQIFEGVTELELRSDNEEQLSINEFLLETEMAASPSRRPEERYAGAGEDEDQGGQCQDDQCAQCSEERACGEGGGHGATFDVDAASTSSQAAASSGGGHNFYDPLLNRGSYANYSEGGLANSDNGSGNGQLCQEACCTGSASGSTASRSGRSGRRQRQQQQQGQSPNCHTSLLTPEMMSNKTSKEIYKDLAKQWGITCKMSESCRCMDCQSHYFDCDYDDNEHQKTDGGLGAGTPMFISEVMHGSGCNIL
ncbi:hyphally regulated cell wall protein 3 [Drosophila rhopaloa]|uniref:Hyphally regulated cell wall protein 3 n=1 Tax=Drosophila rhopaloa TaxID=1041015 RepID=A0A6P4EIC6_DRORH|nr:hyphally regulated cell wall protein 3 [Drosophila rhopaloa]